MNASSPRRFGVREGQIRGETSPRGCDNRSAHIPVHNIADQLINPSSHKSLSGPLVVKGSEAGAPQKKCCVGLDLFTASWQLGALRARPPTTHWPAAQDAIAPCPIERGRYFIIVTVAPVRLSGHAGMAGGQAGGWVCLAGSRGHLDRICSPLGAAPLFPCGQVRGVAPALCSRAPGCRDCGFAMGHLGRTS